KVRALYLEQAAVSREREFADERRARSLFPSGRAVELRVESARCGTEVRAGEAKVNRSGGRARERHGVAGEYREQAARINVLETSLDARSRARRRRNRRAPSRVAAKDVGDEVAQLNLIVRRDYACARAAQIHRAEHAAAKTQVRARAVATAWPKCEVRARESDVIGASLLRRAALHGRRHCERDRARFDVVRGSLDATARRDREAHARDVETARARTRRVET